MVLSALARGNGQEDHDSLVTLVSQETLEVALGALGALSAADGLHLRGRAADEDLDLVGLCRRLSRQHDSWSVMRTREERE